MQKIKNYILQSKHEKPVLVDVYYTSNKQPKPIIIFAHGYKGYKDWACWNVMAETFAKKGFCFVKFNFSHNGGTAENPIDFPDLEAFANNNFIKELDDLETVIDFVCTNTVFANEIDTNKLSLMAHSRGGGIVLIKASEDTRISKVITLAGVSDFGVRFPKGAILDQWKKDNVVHVENTRTKQQMPHYFQFYKNFKENEERLTIKHAVTKLQIPYLIIHGTKDTTVTLQEAKNLQQWNANNTLEIIEQANHSFGSQHPWEEVKLPKHLQEVVEKVVVF